MVERDLLTLRDVLQSWIERNLPDRAPVEIVRLVAAEGGLSSETYLVDARTGPKGNLANWVLRVEPRARQIYEDPSVERQFKMIRTLRAHSDLPVPESLAYEGNEALIGAPFFLMERASGVAPPNGYHVEGLFTDISAGEREALWEKGIALLAQLHMLDPAPFAFLGYPVGQASSDAITQELERWDSYQRWDGEPPTPLFNRARSWLEENRPSRLVPGVAWGDARPTNMLFEGGRCTALLDWETASLGAAETDLGWWIFYDEMITQDIGQPRLAGIGDRERTIAAWEGYAGRRLASMEWHILFAGYRFAMISERAVRLAVAAGHYPASAMGAGNPAVRRLEQLLALVS